MSSLLKKAAIFSFACLIGVVGGRFLFAEPDAEKKDVQSVLPLEDLLTFTQVFNRIKQAYVEDVDDATLLNYAIEGMLSGLDPHSAYLDTEEFEDLQINTKGEFGGLGIEVTMEDGYVKVVSPIEDTPAQKAGLESGDLIIKLDDTTVKGMSLMDAVKVMRGKPGEELKITVAREGVAPFEVVIVRAIIKVQSIKTKELEAGYGYLRITQFQIETGNQLKKAIAEIKKANQPLKGLVLDVRNNPGGTLKSAVEVADAFLKEGLIVYTKGRAANSELTFEATPGDMIDGAPIVVLINQGTASASEIISGALQDHHRAVIMGEKSFGKGSVQQVLALSDTQGIKLTTALYYTPAGRSIQAEGIEPDILVEPLKVAKVEQGISLISEASLIGHLEKGKEDKTKQSPANQSTKFGEESDKENLAEKDYVLYQALNLLKGLNTYSLHQKPKVKNAQLAVDATAK